MLLLFLDIKRVVEAVLISHNKEQSSKALSVKHKGLGLGLDFRVVTFTNCHQIIITKLSHWPSFLNPTPVTTCQRIRLAFARNCSKKCRELNTFMKSTGARGRCVGGV